MQKRIFALAMGFPLLSALLTAACGGSDDTSDGGGSTGGETSATGGGAGEASGGSGTGGKSGSGGSNTGGAMGGDSGTGGADAIGDTLGSTCGDDDDCQGMTCVLATSDAFGGGVANGYCSLECTGDADCPGYLSACVEGWCRLGCDATDPPLEFLNEPLDAAKCRGREDVACVEIAAATTVCEPYCFSDADCGERFCDTTARKCVDAPDAGLPDGAPCTGPDDTSCAGQCVSVSGAVDGKVNVCSSVCVLGGDLESGDCGGKPWHCVYAPFGKSAGNGGYCAAGCQTHGDCGPNNFTCNDLGIESEGLCLASKACESDDQCDAGSKCLDTNVGKYCGSDKYALGTRAP